MNKQKEFRLEDKHLPLDNSVHAEVTDLFYDLNHSHPDWSELALKFPNLTGLNLNYYGRREPNRTPDAQLFIHFPKLECLSCTDLPLILTSEQAPFLQHLKEVNNAQITDATSFAVLTGLPAITSLDLRCVGRAVELHSTTSDALKKLRMVILDADSVRINLTQSNELTHFDLYIPRDHNNGQHTHLSLPTSLENLDIGVTGELNLDTELPSLTHVDLTGCLPDILQHSKQLHTLKLCQYTAETLPEWLYHLPKLQALTLFSCDVASLGDMSAFTALNKLRLKLHSYDQPYCYKAPILATLNHAPQLQELKVELSRLPQDISNLEDLVTLPDHIELDVQVYDHIARSDELNKLIGILKAASLSDEQRRHYWLLLLATPKPKNLAAESLDARFHLTFMEAKFNPVKVQAQAWLRSRAQADSDRRPLGTDSVLFVNGKIPFTATELKAKAEELDFTISKKLTDSVTHVVLGANPKNTAALTTDHLLIDDTALKQWFEQAAPQFLQTSGSETMIEGVLAMLGSPDVTSHQVAVQMLQQGGITDDLIIPLFLILKTINDKNLRKDIKKLLSGYGDEYFQLAVQDRIFFEDNLRGLNWEKVPTGEGPMYQKLKGLPKRWGRELTITFAKAYFDRFGEGLLWVLIQKEECAQRQSIIDELIDGECLNWHKGCGFARVLEGADEECLIDCHRYPDIYMQNSHELDSAKTYLPAQLPATRKITEIDMHNCFLADLPANIEHYVDVTTLNLHFNHLSTLPAKLSKLSQLETLDLSYNHFDEFPAVLFKLKKLKRLDLRRAREPLYSDGYSQQHGYEPIRAPQAFRDAFPHCEILEDE